MPLQRFHLQSRIGRALYGDVWIAQDTQQNHDLVAIKQVSLQRAKRILLTNKDIDNPFDERQMVRYLMTLDQHENILQYHLEFINHGSWYLVMEYCKCDLLTRLQTAPQSRLLPDVAMGYFKQITQGVRFLHNIGIAHRDISLENVLLKDDVCKLCDFGLSTTNQICRERVGKAFYMAPEVVAGKFYDPMQADMWSLGILLFVLLTGSPLVPLASRTEQTFVVFEAVGVENVLQAWDLAFSIPTSIIHLLRGLLQVNPAKRLTIQKVVAYQLF